MKKFQFSVFAMMIMALVCVGFTSCGSDDDDNVSGSISWLLNGTWTESNGIRKWTFYKDGTCRFEVDNQTWSPKTGYVSNWTSKNGQWSYDDNTKVLSTTLSWNWVIVSHSDNMWTGKGSKESLYTYYKE